MLNNLHLCDIYFSTLSNLAYEFIFGYSSYKGLLDIHLLNMARHSSGRYSGAVCPPPCKVDQRLNKLVMILSAWLLYINFESEVCL